MVESLRGSCVDRKLDRLLPSSHATERVDYVTGNDQ